MCIPVCSTGWGFFTSISSIISSRNWKTYSLCELQGCQVWGWGCEDGVMWWGGRCEDVRVRMHVRMWVFISRLGDQERHVKYGSTVITASTAALTASLTAWDTLNPRDMLEKKRINLTASQICSTDMLTLRQTSCSCCIVCLSILFQKLLHWGYNGINI